ARSSHRNTVRHHEVNELGNTRLPGPRRLIFWNDHLGDVLHHLIVLRRKKQRFVRSGGGGRTSRPRMVLGTGKCPFVEARKCPGHRGDSDITKNLSPFYTLSAQSVCLKTAFSESGFIQAIFLASLRMPCQARTISLQFW